MSAAPVPEGSTIAVMGAGAWGTTFARVLADADHRVRLWARRSDVVDEINATARNGLYLPGVDLPPTISATADPAEAMTGASMVVLAVPSQFLRATLSDWQVPDNAIVVNLAKGIEVCTGLRMSQVICEVARIEPDRHAVFTGPNLAREIAERQPTAAVIASSSEDTASLVQRACHTGYLRPYTNRDVIGCEIGGATKNVIALAYGMAVGAGAGSNALAWLLTRGLAEVTRLGEALGADPLTFAGLAGMGDLVATCSSSLSRNRTFGEHLGRGHSVDEATRESRGVAEGVRSCMSIRALAHQHGVEMPIVEAVSLVVAGEVRPLDMVRVVMERSLKSER